MTNGPAHPAPQKSRRRLFAIVVGLIIAVGGSAAWYMTGRPAIRARRWLAQARYLRSTGDDQEAEQAALTAAQLDPELTEANFMAAECAAARGDFRHAVDHLQQLASADRQLRVRAALLMARLNHHRLHRFTDAEHAYRAALELAPDDVEANTGLANLLALCGRTREAVPCVLRIVRLGEPTDLLVLLARPDGVVHDSTALAAARRADPDDPNPLVGSAWHAASEERHAEAIQLLKEAIRLAPQHLAAQVALGKQLLALHLFEELARWNERLPSTAEEFAETWLVRAQMAENDGDAAGAIRCYWEALRRAPESKTANSRLARLLDEAQEIETSKRFAGQVRRLQELESAQNHVLFSSDGEIDPLLALARSYESAGRLWEACGWCQTAVQTDSSRDDARRYLAELRQKVDGIPLTLTVASANAALAVDLSAYPLPRFRGTPASPLAIGGGGATAMSFQDDAEAVGLSFSYFNGTSGPPSRRMFEFTGGGIGILDYDLDGFADVYFTQGRPWPPTSSATGYGDRMFRNHHGAHFEDVTLNGGFDEAGFGQGIAVGDFNADGFPDIYAAHIGDNQLLLNNGDGTFANVTREAGVQGDPADWTTSCLMADLDGDGLPDIYAANYVTAPDVFERVCRHHPDGAPMMCMPFDFEGRADRLWINQGDGQFRDATADLLLGEGNGKGLGLAAWDARGTGRLSLLVANDTTPNSFFVAEPARDRPASLQDRGIECGLAVNGEGKAKGNMGIALGDVNGDGELDVYITNFLGEANTLFVSAPGGFYQDRTRESGLHDLSLDVLGFGTQFLDVDLDGRLELFTANGHIDDLRQYGKPYRMPPRLYRWHDRSFVQVDATELGPYFNGQWLGRAVARLDWNRDGRDDLVVGHLADRAALLTNTTQTAGRYLSLRLFGVQSNRDAIGTTVSARVGQQTIVRQLTAGDGYQASNERRLIFGTGNASQIDEMVVRWPSGTIQRFHDVPTPQEVWLREGSAFIVAPAARD